MQRIAALAPILAVSLLLSACGQGQETESDDHDVMAGFQSNAQDTDDSTHEMPDDVAMTEDSMAPEEDMAMMDDMSEEEGTAISEEQIVPEDPSFNPNDPGEDLYQRGLYQEALETWETEAEDGNAYAAYRLGVEYFDAHHVERDIAAAARYQQLAAELGSSPAMFELGSFYEGGLGVPQSNELAAEWYLASAQRGFAPAQHNVATMFEDGTGVDRDLVQAYLYYSLAIEQGFRVNFDRGEDGQSTFVDPRLHLAQMMSDEEQEEAEAAIAAFTPVE